MIWSDFGFDLDLGFWERFVGDGGLVKSSDSLIVGDVSEVLFSYW